MAAAAALADALDAELDALEADDAALDAEVEAALADALALLACVVAVEADVDAEDAEDAALDADVDAAEAEDAALVSAVSAFVSAVSAWVSASSAAACAACAALIAAVNSGVDVASPTFSLSVLSAGFNRSVILPIEAAPLKYFRALCEHHAGCVVRIILEKLNTDRPGTKVFRL